MCTDIWKYKQIFQLSLSEVKKDSKFISLKASVVNPEVN